MIYVAAKPVLEGQDFVIADGKGTRGPGGRILVDDLSGGFSHQLQTVMNFRAPAEQRFDRRNKGGTMELVAEYTFASQGQCLIFLLGLQTAVPALAHVEIRAGTARKLLSNCGIPSIRYTTIGEVAARVTYTLQFGLIT